MPTGSFQRHFSNISSNNLPITLFTKTWFLSFRASFSARAHLAQVRICCQALNAVTLKTKESSVPYDFLLAYSPPGRYSGGRRHSLLLRFVVGQHVELPGTFTSVLNCTQIGKSWYRSTVVLVLCFFPPLWQPWHQTARDAYWSSTPCSRSFPTDTIHILIAMSSSSLSLLQRNLAIGASHHRFASFT